MARTPKPWFRKQTGWWMVTLGGRQHKLAQGRENKRLAELMGHRDTTMISRVYGHLAKQTEHLAAAVEKAASVPVNGDRKKAHGRK